MKRELGLVLAFAMVAPAVYAQREAGQTPGRDSNQALESSDKHHVKHIRGSNLIGSKVKSKDGGNLGEVDDIMFDPQTGQIQFVVLGKGGFLGIGEKLVPVPWRAINVESEREFTVNVDQQKLRTAPTFESQQHAELSNPDVILRVYRFYEVEPIGVGAPGTDTEAERGREQQQQRRQPQPDRN